MRATLLALALLMMSGCDEADEPAPPCVADSDEPADQTQSVSLGTLQDDGEPLGNEEPTKRVRVGKSLHDDADVDDFSVSVQDTGLGGNPNVYVIVSEGFKATVTPTCTNGTMENMRCQVGEPVTSGGKVSGCITNIPTVSGAAPQITMDVECAGTSTDSLAIRIRVERNGAAPGCARYGLTVSTE